MFRLFKFHFNKLKILRARAQGPNENIIVDLINKYKKFLNFN
jgi:hypothetical protein